MHQPATLNVRKEPITSPQHGSSLALLVYGGAQPGRFLATGFFTGESTRNPLALPLRNSRLIFRNLRAPIAHRSGFQREARESSSRNPVARKTALGRHLSLNSQKTLIPRIKMD